MATNRVEISPSNIPVWAPHEPVIHAFTHLRLRLKWGTGFPGSGGDIDLFGTVHLSKFRLVFVPDVPTREFFSFVVPLSCISQIKSDVSSHSSSSASRLKTGFANLFKGFSSSSAQDSSYELSEDHVNENARLKRLSFVLRPMVNERTDPMGLAMVLSGIPVIPTAPIVTTGVVTTMCEVSLTPKHVGDSGEEASRCLIHRGTLMSGHPSCPLTTLSTSLTSAVAAATASLAPGAASNAVLALAHVAAVQTPQDFGEYEFACAALGLPQATAPAPEDVFPPGDPVVPFPASTGTGAGSDRASNLIGGGLQRRTWQDDAAAEERARAQRQQMRDEHFRRQAERERANAGGEDIEPTGAAHVGMLGSVNANSATAAVSSDEYTDAHAASADPAAPAAAAAQASALPPVPRSGSPAPPPYHATLPVLGPGVIANPYPDALRARPVQADLFGAGYDANATGNDRIEVGWTGEVRRVPSPVPLPAPEHLHGHGHAQGGSEPGNAAGGAGSDDEEEERAEEAREVAAAEVAAQGGKAPAPHTIREDLHSAGQFVERVADAVVHGMNVDRGDANAPPPGYNDAMADKEKEKKTQSATETEVEGETSTQNDKNEEDEEEGVPSAVSM